MPSRWFIQRPRTPNANRRIFLFRTQLSSFRDFCQSSLIAIHTLLDNGLRGDLPYLPSSFCPILDAPVMGIPTPGLPHEDRIPNGYEGASDDGLCSVTTEGLVARLADLGTLVYPMGGSRTGVA